jgi:L-lactate dehydrogenase complex protein LldG
MSEKESILGRIREALRAKAPVPGFHDGDRESHLPSESETLEKISQWLPLVGNQVDDWIELFAKNSDELKTSFHLLENRGELSDRMAELASSEGWARIAWHTTTLTEEALRSIDLPKLSTDESFDINELEHCDAGITGCDALIAQTGSIAVSSHSAGGRALSVVPPHHVVIATRDQFVPDLTAAFAVLREHYSGGFPSFMSFVTGPSRTGDIERILVLGAHGPKKLTVFCV